MAKAALKKPRKKANGYKMPDPLPFGEILTDIAKKQWKLGRSIGVGGFGEIYEAQEASASSKYPYVIKVEPHGNGPLFVEMHFYMKNAKPSNINEFAKKHKLKTFGMPAYYGSGSHEFNNVKYRFIVMEKFGTDIEKLRLENKGHFPTSTVFQLAWQISYVLEYIHEEGYVHADIKGGNVLLGATPETKNQVYLLDFGLATRYTTEKEFKSNPKKAHDGTIEYLSRDAHYGVPTRRGDFEILAYNLIHWLGGKLPWESKLDDPKIVQQIKEESMKDIPKFVKSCLKDGNETVVKFLEHVNSLKFNEKPDYKKMRTLFEQAVRKTGLIISSALEFSSSIRKRRSNEDKIDIDTIVKKPLMRKEKIQKKEHKENAEEVMTMTPAMREVLARRKEKEVKKTIKKKVKVTKSSPGKVEGFNEEMKENGKKTETRSRRNVPAVNYSENSSSSKYSL